jgi:hypothetical protein
VIASESGSTSPRLVESFSKTGMSTVALSQTWMKESLRAIVRSTSIETTAGSP